jgi:hypothetical protein
MLINNKISPIRLIDGGAPIFIAKRMNQNRDIQGKILIKPLTMKILRVEVFSYIILAKENIPEDTNP